MQIVALYAGIQFDEHRWKLTWNLMHSLISVTLGYHHYSRASNLLWGITLTCCIFHGRYTVWNMFCLTWNAGPHGVLNSMACSQSNLFLCKLSPQVNTTGQPLCSSVFLQLNWTSMPFLTSTRMPSDIYTPTAHLWELQVMNYKIVAQRQNSL